MIFACFKQQKQQSAILKGDLAHLSLQTSTPKT